MIGILAPWIMRGLITGGVLWFASAQVKELTGGEGAIAKLEKLVYKVLDSPLNALLLVFTLIGIAAKYKGFNRSLVLYLGGFLIFMVYREYLWRKYKGEVKKITDFVWFKWGEGVTYRDAIESGEINVRDNWFDSLNP